MNRMTNVLLITVDTLRADHLGCYGYHRPVSPNIDKLASQGVLAERFFCAGIPTQREELLSIRRKRYGTVEATSVVPIGPYT